MKCLCMEPTLSHLEFCASRLREGKLVAFPTETVYGLGANMHLEDSCSMIYHMKKRPSGDPLIVHLYEHDQVYPLVYFKTPLEHLLFEALSTAFWPGPLTLITHAQEKVPSVVTGGGRTVGLRMPAMGIAQTFLRACGVPVPAPSANLYGHVSPTLAQHVQDDFKEEDLVVLDGGPSSIGIESTVVRCVDDRVEVLRQGFITVSQIQEVVQKVKSSLKVEVMQKRVLKTTSIQDAPGQSLTHYAPRIPTFMLQDENPHFKSVVSKVEDWGLVDFGGKWSSYEKAFGAYEDLSPASSLSEAMQNLFLVLRKMEEKSLVGLLLVSIPLSLGEESWGMMDRMFRASSGQMAYWFPDSLEVSYSVADVIH